MVNEKKISILKHQSLILELLKILHDCKAEEDPSQVEYVKWFIKENELLAKDLEKI